MRPRIFLDTTVLLKSFAAVRKGHPPPCCLLEPAASRITFEKCLIEAYMAFRGVGGKKPDEGRGRWAQMNLTSADDPAPLSKLASRLHYGQMNSALFWINQILEAQCSSEEAGGFEISEGGPDRAPECEQERLRQLLRERKLFDRLCTEFERMLKDFGISVLSYQYVFGEKAADMLRWHGGFSAFARNTALASEDFEIVVAALLAGSDIVVTDDERLIRSVYSSGLNSSLTVANFCTTQDYREKVHQWSTQSLVAAI